MSCRSYDKPYGADEVLKARIEDAADLSAVRKAPCFVGFLDERQADLSSKIARNLGVQGFMLWGGYEDAQRRMFAAFPKELLPDSERFPVISIYLSFRKEDSLSHRDFLGALMGLGIKREALGDILVGEGRCVLFCKEEIANFVETQLTKVGRTGWTALWPALSVPAGKKADSCFPRAWSPIIMRWKNPYPLCFRRAIRCPSKAMESSSSTKSARKPKKED